MVNSKVLALVLVVVIVGGGAGVYLLLASPAPVYTTTVDLSGILVAQDYNVTIAFPNSQMQIAFEITDHTGLYAMAVFDSTASLVYDFGFLPASGIEISTWLPASGVYTISFIGVGDITGILTVFARGAPFIT